MVENKVSRIYQNLDLRVGFKTIVICNTWRIDRCLSSANIEAFEWSYEHKSWLQIRSFEKWPAIRLFPMQSRPKAISAKWFAIEILEKAYLYALHAAGFSELRNVKKECASHQRLKNAFIKRFVGWLYLEGGMNGLEEKKISSVFRAACALRKNIWNVVIDRPLLSLVSTLNGWGYSLYLDRYLVCAMHAASVKRIASEHRNCLPLLVLIKPESWARLDLFSRSTWVKDGRMSTLIDRQGTVEGRRLASFMAPATYRWLLAAPITVVLEYVQTPHPVALENIASSNLPKKVPAIVLRAILKVSRKLDRQVMPEYQRIIRLWVVHCCQAWQEQGYAHVRNYMNQFRRKLVDVLDWAEADGVAKHLPDKNSTWASVERLSMEWHEQQAARHAPPSRNLSWHSRLSDCEIDEFRVNALTCSTSLQEEGILMHHCVGSYDVDCHEGYIRIFSLTDSQGLRSTLSIEDTGDNTWRVEQVRGVCNGEVSDETMQVSKKIANRYTEIF